MSASQGLQRLTNLFHRGLLDLRIAHDPALPYLSPSGFELRFYQNHGLPTASLRRLREGSRDHRRQNQSRGDEGDIHHDYIYSFADLLWREIAGVGLFQQTDASVLPEPKIDLAMARIDRKDARGTMLQKAIGKSPG